MRTAILIFFFRTKDKAKILEEVILKTRKSLRKIKVVKNLINSIMK